MSAQDYLNRYGLVSRAPKFLRRQWDYVASVPLAGEPDGGEQTLRALEQAAAQTNGRVLIILVLNSRRHCSAEFEAGNERTRHWVGPDSPAPGWQLRQKAQVTFALWDWAGERRFEDDDGVGRARRLGADLAAALHVEGYLTHPLLWTTDADAVVPQNYFSAPLGQRLGGCAQGEAVGLYPFHHPSDRAHRLYDLYLKYHPRGLAYAGSPFAYAAVGSTLRIPLEPYCLARGFPLRMAGEDFHLLNKMAKLVPIRAMESEPIVLSGRPSDRVPFGTGRATARLADRSLLLDDPEIYEALGVIVRWARASLEAPTPLRAALVSRYGEELGEWVAEESGLAQTALDLAWETRRRSEDRWRHWWNHFDGLRTYQWVRRLRKRFPPLPFTEALARAPFPVPEATGLEDAADLPPSLAHGEGTELPPSH